MIKLKSLLNEMDVARKRYSWQYPNGMFIPVKSSHGQDAYKLTGVNDDPIMSLWKKGYQRVVFMGNVLIAHNEVIPPNDKQRQALIDLAIETGDNMVEYDGGEKNAILWSANDVLEEKYNIYHSHPIMWTLDSAKFIAEKLKAKIVGSVVTKNQSKHDLDLRIENYNHQNTVKILNDIGFEYMGSQIVSPDEIKKSKKKYGIGWQRGENFEDDKKRRIQIWHDEL